MVMTHTNPYRKGGPADAYAARFKKDGEQPEREDARLLPRVPSRLPKLPTKILPFGMIPVDRTNAL